MYLVLMFKCQLTDLKFKFLQRMTQNLPHEEILIAQNNNSNVAFYHSLNGYEFNGLCYEMCTRYFVKCYIEAIFASIKVKFQKYYLNLFLFKEDPSQNYNSVFFLSFFFFLFFFFFFFCHGCDTWLVTLMEEHRLRVFVNRVLRRIFGPKRDEVTGVWRKLHNEEFNDMYCLPNVFSDDQVKNN